MTISSMWTDTAKNTFQNQVRINISNIKGGSNCIVDRELDKDKMVEKR